MWRIVKAELNYLKWPLIASYAFFLAVTLLISFKGDPDKLYTSALFLPFYISFVHFIMNLTLIYLEMRDVRLRYLTPLPVPKIRIGIARLLTPFFIWLAYVLLTAICIFVLLSRFDVLPLSNIANPSPDETQAGLILVFPSQADSGHFFIPQLYQLQLLHGLCIWLAFTYLVRLFSELYGRILLLIIALLILFDNLLLPIIYRPLARNLDAYIGYILEDHGLWVVPGLAVLFCSLIQISFMRRRSFLN